MAHGDCFVQGKALAPILGGQDVIARTLTKPLTKEELNSELDEAIAECDRGDFVTAEELEKEMVTW
jgi:predicted transcriptional regulator